MQKPLIKKEVSGTCLVVELSTDFTDLNPRHIIEDELVKHGIDVTKAYIRKRMAMQFKEVYFQDIDLCLDKKEAKKRQSKKNSEIVAEESLKDAENIVDKALEEVLEDGLVVEDVVEEENELEDFQKEEVVPASLKVETKPKKKGRPRKSDIEVI